MFLGAILVFGKSGRADLLREGVRPMNVTEVILLLTLVIAAIQLGINIKR